MITNFTIGFDLTKNSPDLEEFEFSIYLRVLGFVTERWKKENFSCEYASETKLVLFPSLRVVSYPTDALFLL